MRPLLDHDHPAKPLRPRPAKGFRIDPGAVPRNRVSPAELRSVHPRRATDEHLIQNVKPGGRAYVMTRAAPTRSSRRRRLGRPLTIATIFFCFSFFGTPSTRKYSSNIADRSRG